MKLSEKDRAKKVRKDAEHRDDVFGHVSRWRTGGPDPYAEGIEKSPWGPIVPKPTSERHDVRLGGDRSDGIVGERSANFELSEGQSPSLGER